MIKGNKRERDETEKERKKSIYSCPRERERQIERKIVKKKERKKSTLCLRERERKTETEIERQRESERLKMTQLTDNTSENIHALI